MKEVHREGSVAIAEHQVLAKALDLEELLYAPKLGDQIETELISFFIL